MVNPKTRSLPNNYFQFKQFIIRQERCAMNVSTDACLLGAWVAERIGASKNILDIGAGTGLLMLMLAQKSECPIDGIELDGPSYAQLQENITGSPWSDRLRAFEGDARTIELPQQYDLIISNPPFYDGDLNSPSAEKNLARHSSALSLEELLNLTEKHLAPRGRFAVLLPYHRSAYFEFLAREKKYYCNQKLMVRQSPAHSYFRSLLLFSKDHALTLPESTLIIKNSNGVYTGAFNELMKDYYLNL
jgi:tRNA1Val (adenine37-N6)-methyltransferase